MNTEIKEYKKLSYIHCYDNKIFYTPLSIDNLEKVMSEGKFLNLGDSLIAISNIKRIETKTIGAVENRILNMQDEEVQELIRLEIKKRNESGKKTNITILENMSERLLFDKNTI